MSTIRQIEANRLNAKKCTGPRSAEGKARSSMNALKSGIDANSRIIRGEKAEDLTTLAAEYHTRWIPTTPEQRMLVDTLVFNEWLQRRMATVEAQLWQDNKADYSFEESIWAGQAFGRGSRDFERLQRRLNAIQRNYRTALQDLRRLQTEEAAESQAAEQAEQATQPDPLSVSPAPPTPPTPDPQQNQPPAPQIGFVPQPIPQPPAGPPRPGASARPMPQSNCSGPAPTLAFHRSAPLPRAVDVTFSTVLP